MTGYSYSRCNSGMIPLLPRIGIGIRLSICTGIRLVGTTLKFSWCMFSFKGVRGLSVMEKYAAGNALVSSAKVPQ